MLPISRRLEALNSPLTDGRPGDATSLATEPANEAETPGESVGRPESSVVFSLTSAAPDSSSARRNSSGLVTEAAR